MGAFLEKKRGKKMLVSVKFGTRFADRRLDRSSSGLILVLWFFLSNCHKERAKSKLPAGIIYIVNKHNGGDCPADNCVR